ncbi:coiled-coil domain-containing protein [Microbispora sp. NPDC049125]|uniref:coiled-coil domain-containing protein n=1 Tax=Microbispora sp. NPDC049125 TaxID=3154929 RepID=UPI0034656B81
MRSGRLVGLAVVTAALLGALGVPGASGVAADPDQQAKLRNLTKQAADLAKAYRGEILSLEDAQKAASKASRKVGRLKTDLRSAERRVAEFAQASYMGVGLDGPQLFTTTGDLGTLSTSAYLSSARSEQLINVRWLVDQQKKAAKDADAEIDKLQKHIKDLQAKRRDVERRMAKFGFQTPDAGSGLTSRMVTVRNAIMQNFPMPFGVGCLRAGDPGEHGKGRACDFMMSSGGRMPDVVAKERGDALAKWCIDNADQYGIMYIIWQQRFYDMRTGTGWRTMSDRGGITANHYDHVHVSVL